MSIQDENKMLYILHKKGVKRENIKWIMNDLKKSGVFDTDREEDDYYDNDFQDNIRDLKRYIERIETYGK